MRGGRDWFAVTSKSFDIPVEEVGGRLRSVIVKQGMAFSSQVRFVSIVQVVC